MCAFGQWCRFLEFFKSITRMPGFETWKVDLIYGLKCGFWSDSEEDLNEDSNSGL